MLRRTLVHPERCFTVLSRQLAQTGFGRNPRATKQKPSNNKDFRMAESLANELSSMSLATGAMVAAPAAEPLICPRATEYKPPRFRSAETPEIFLRFLRRAQLPERAAGEPRDKCDTDVIIQLVRHPQMTSTDPLRTVRWFRGARGAKGVEFAKQEGNDGFNKANDFMNIAATHPSAARERAGSTS